MRPNESFRARHDCSFFHQLLVDECMFFKKLPADIRQIRAERRTGTFGVCRIVR
jgi:hypothetical protein